MSNVLRLVGIVIVIGLVGYVIFWTVTNRDTIFKSTSTQTTNSETAQTQNTQQQSETSAVTAQGDLPKLEEVLPQDGFATSDEKVVIKGKTTPGNKISINNQEIVVDENGNFAQSIVLSDGANKISLIAKDPTGKENILGLIYNRSASAPANNSPIAPNTNLPTINAAPTPQNPTKAIRTGGENLVLPVIMLLTIVPLVINYPKKSNL
jgi:FtsZ-interacting cell division protein ZipA